jgi:hypothetical protein
MTDKDAMKLALDALETEVSIDWTNDDEFSASAEKMHEAITALKARLADHMREVQRLGQEIEQEPVAWQFMNGSSFRKRRPDDFSDLASDGLPYWRPLYTTPPQRTWVGLTDEDIGDAYVAWDDTDGASFADFARAIEAKLKQKNGYAEEKNT